MNQQPNLDEILALRQSRGDEVVDVDEPALKLVIFALGDQWFALPGEKVREILPQVPVFFVPGCPASLEGVINVRGDIESVIRLGPLLGQAQAAPSRHNSILIGQAAGMRSGLRVDAVVEVLDMPESAIKPPLGALPAQLAHLITGTTLHRGRPVSLIDLDRLFDDYRRGLGPA